MKQMILDFFRKQDGAVTVDWVVLTAAIVGLGLMVLMPIAYSTTSLSTNTGASIGALGVGYSPSTP